jgi:hypothetical protein
MPVEVGRRGQKFVWAVPPVGDDDRGIRADVPQHVDVVDVHAARERQLRDLFAPLLQGPGESGTNTLGWWPGKVEEKQD